MGYRMSKMNKITGWILVLSMWLQMFGWPVEVSAVEEQLICWIEADAVASSKSVTISYKMRNEDEMEGYTAWRSVVRKNKIGQDDIVRQTQEIFLEDKGTGEWEYQERFRIGQDGIVEGVYEVTYYLMSSFGEKIEAEKMYFCMDRQAPEIDITCGQESVTKEDVICKVKIQDLMPELCDVTLYARKISSSGKKEMLVFQNENLVFDGNEEYEMQFQEEGIYSVWVQVTDVAGHTTSTGDAPISFTIDKSAPELLIYEKSGTDGFSYNAPEKMQMQLEIKDLCLGVIEKDISVQIQKDGEEKTIIPVDWKEDYLRNESEDTIGSLVTGVILFEENMEEGSYSLCLQAIDAAGNCAVHNIHFIIDRTCPCIDVNDVEVICAGEEGDSCIYREEEKRYYLNGNAVVQIRAVEENYKDAYVYIKTKRNEQWLPGQRLSLQKQEEVLSVSYSEEGEYETQIQGKDAAGNTGMLHTVQYVIDNTAPLLSICGAENNGETTQPVQLTFSAQDMNAEVSTYQICVKYTDEKGVRNVDTITGEQLSSYDVNQGWERKEINDNGYLSEMVKRELCFKQDGYYEIVFSGMDKAMNTAQSEILSFTIDQSAPVITNIRYDAGKNEIRQLQQSVYSRKGIVIRFKAMDLIAGLNENEMYVTIGNPEDKRTGTVRYMVSVDKEKGEYIVRIPEDIEVSELNQVVTIWAEDNFGNRTYAVSKKIVYNISDIDIVMQSEINASQWTNKNVEWNIMVKDESAGLKEIVYKVNGKVVDSVKFDELICSYTKNIEVMESAQTPEGYMIDVEVVNNCGISSIQQRQMRIDKINPLVQLSGVNNGMHYNSNQTICTEVRELSYANTITEYYISRVLEGRKEQMFVPAFYSKKEVDENELIFTEEGKYEIYAVTTDGAGNRSVSNMLSFVIDKSAPDLEITGIEKNQMSNEMVGLRFACKEAFFETCKVEIQVERDLNGEKSEWVITDFPKNKIHSVMKKSFSEEGVYNVTMLAWDKAGNIAPTQKMRFTVDKTAPEIRIWGTENYQGFAESVMVQLEVKELYYTKNRISVSGTKRNIAGEVEEIELSRLESKGIVSSLSQLFEEDGIYQLKIMATDGAGNHAEKEIHFTVDKTAPEINNIELYDGKYYQIFQIVHSTDELFRDLTVTNYRMLLNGVEYDGKEIVKEEGKYCLYVEAVDEMGNQSIQEATFIVDSTAPEIVFTGVGENDVVYESGNVSLALKDGDDIITAVRMNGVNCGANTRSLTYTEYGQYEIEVDCTDKAGNAATAVLSFVYRNPRQIRLVEWISVLVMVGFGVSIGLFIWRRNGKRIRRDRNNER